MRRFANTPRLEVEQTKQEVQNFNETFKANIGTKFNKEMKMATKEVTRKEAVEMKAAYHGGESQGDIAKRYTEMGYLTVSGKKLSNWDVSYYIRSKAKGRGPNKVTRTVVQKVANTTESLLAGILSSSLSESKKLKVIAAMVG